jgi:hypothetical protein
LLHTVQVHAPRVNDRRGDPDTGEHQRFASAILPPWARKTPKITEVLPLPYLHGVSTSDFGPALDQFLGSSARLSASVISTLTKTWRAEQRAFAAQDLSRVAYVYPWADGIHINIRLEEHKLCLLVLIGVRVDSRKELVALADGYRSPPSPGPICCAIAPGAGCAPRSSPSGTARSDSGRTPPCRPRPCRRRVQDRQARRTTRRRTRRRHRSPKILIHRS